MGAAELQSGILQLAAMVHATHAVWIAGLAAAAGCVLVARAAFTPLRRGNADVLEEPTTPLEIDSSNDGSSEDSASTGLLANNTIRIQDSRIVLTDRDRAQLLRSIAHALVADHAKQLAASTPTPTPLVTLSRDAFLYVTPPVGANATVPLVRLGWRYPLATWATYKAWLPTDGCDVQRVIGDYFYC